MCIFYSSAAFTRSDLLKLGPRYSSPRRTSMPGLPENNLTLIRKPSFLHPLRVLQECRVILEIIFDLPFGFPINHIISLASGVPSAAVPRLLVFWASPQTTVSLRRDSAAAPRMLLRMQLRGTQDTMTIDIQRANDARLTWMFFSFSSSAKGQITQTTTLIQMMWS